MTSSGGGDDGMGMMALMGQGTPMPGLPIAGQGAGVDPTTYGKYQSFLPEPLAEGPNPMATGLRPDMLKFRSPGGGADASSGGGTSGEIEALRGELAKLTAGGGGGNPNAGTMSQDMLVPGNERLGMGFMGGGGGGGVGTMGMGRGGGFGPAGNGVAPPANATQLPTPPGGWASGNVPGWPMGGPGTPKAAPGVNTGPAAAAAAAANLASGGLPPGRLASGGFGNEYNNGNPMPNGPAGFTGNSDWSSLDPETVRRATLKGMT